MRKFQGKHDEQNIISKDLQVLMQKVPACDCNWCTTIKIIKVGVYEKQQLVCKCHFISLFTFMFCAQNCKIPYEEQQRFQEYCWLRKLAPCNKAPYAAISLCKPNDAAGKQGVPLHSILSKVLSEEVNPWPMLSVQFQPQHHPEECYRTIPRHQ